MRNKRTCQLVLMEDSEADARLFEIAFQSLSTNLQLIHCYDGNTLLDHVSSVPQSEIALIILDLNVPGMDGIDVLRRLRDQMKVGAVPILIFSNSQHPDDINRCYEIGANAFVTKPMDIDEYDRSVRSFLKFIRKRGMPLAS